MDPLNFFGGLFELAVGIAVFVAASRLADIREELREQSRLLRGQAERSGFVETNRTAPGPPPGDPENERTKDLVRRLAEQKSAQERLMACRAEK
jgi:hypothetical protein